MVKVDKQKCIGCGTCVTLCPEVFEIDEKGDKKARIKNEENLPCIKDAIEACPVEAISE